MHVCGNGVRSTAEACDDNNTVGGDGCDSLCQVETGFACLSTTQSADSSGVGGLDTCAAVCGDGKRISWGGEGCDDGNSVAGDGCGISCAVEAGFLCKGGTTTTMDTCVPLCGDGLRVGSEECDDGDRVAGDGCSAACTIEAGSTCSGGGPSSQDACVPCDASCATCVGSTTDDCTACAPTSPFANESTWAKGACVADCTPLGKYANGTACAACDATCGTCFGPAATDCLSCTVEAYPFLHGATCVAACPDAGYYSDVAIDAEQASCAACASSCLTCSGSASADCLTCPSGSYLDDGSCVA